MKKAIFILGPTGVGKTSIAVELYDKFPSVLISADSVQVFKGLNIISGKDHPKDIDIKMIDIVSPFESYSVGDYVRDAKGLIEEALANGKVPIIVGGTGFYAEALFKKIDTLNIPQNESLREELENKSIEQLHERLKKNDPNKLKGMNESDVKNKRRLIRAIEIAESGSKPLQYEPIFKEDEVLLIGLSTSKEDLSEKIRARIEERIKKGAEKEAKGLFKNYKSLSDQIKSTIGYRNLFFYLSGDVSYDEAIEGWNKDELKLVKKQLTWFRRMDSVYWFDVEKPRFMEEILRLVEHNFTTLDLR